MLENHLDKLLDQFKGRYKSKVSVRQEIIELTECFRNSDGELKAPRGYGNLENNVVFTYMISGAVFAQKFIENETGSPIVEDNKYVLMPFDDDKRVLSCLCIYELRNTSFREVQGARYRDIQGIRNWHIYNIEAQLRRDLSFDPKKDSAFLLSGPRTLTYFRTKLSALLFTRILQQGSRCLKYMDSQEAGFMEKVFPKEILAGDDEAIKMRSYMWGKEIHTVESEEFLRKKVKAYQEFRK